MRPHARGIQRSARILVFIWQIHFHFAIWCRFDFLFFFCKHYSTISIVFWFCFYINLHYAKSVQLAESSPLLRTKAIMTSVY